MPLTETADYAAKREALHKQPCYLVRFQSIRNRVAYDFSWDFVTRSPLAPTRSQYGLVAKIEGNTQTVDLRALTTTRGALAIRLVDRGGLITTYCSNPQLALASALSETEGTALSLSGPAGGYPSPPSDGVGVLGPAGSPAGTFELRDDAGNTERIRYMAIAGAVATGITRGVDGTTPRAWPAGTIVHNGERIARGTRVVVKAGWQDAAEAEMVTIGTFEIVDRGWDPDRVTWVLTCADLQYKAAVAVFQTASERDPVRLGPEHPATLALRVLTSTGDATNGSFDTLTAVNGAAVDAALVNAAAFEALAAQVPGVSVQFEVTKSEPNAAAWVQAQCLAMLDAVIWVDPAGQLSVKRLVHVATAADAVAALTTKNIIGIAAYSTGDRNILNVIDIAYDWKKTLLPGDGAQERYDYQTRQVFEASKSISVDQGGYGKAPANVTGQVFTWQGARTELGAQNYLDDFVARRFKRWGDPVDVAVVNAFYALHHLELGDIATLTHPHLPNQRTGVRGWTDVIVQVIDTRPRWGAEGGIELTLAVLERNATITGDAFGRILVQRAEPDPLRVVENFSAVQNGQNVVLTWARVSEALWYEIREGATWDGAKVIADRVAGLFHVIPNVLDGAHVYRLRAFRAVDDFGPEQTAIVATAGNDPNRNITIDRDEVVLGFPGTAEHMAFFAELTPDALSNMPGLWFSDAEDRWFNELPTLWFNGASRLRYATEVLNQGKYAPTALLLSLKTRVTDAAQWFDSKPDSWFDTNPEDWFTEVRSAATVTVEMRLGFAGEVGIDGAVGFWRLGEEAGATKARDAGVKGNPGTFVGIPELGIAGAVNDGGTAVRLDGVDDYVSIGDPANGSLDFGLGDFALEGWIRFDAPLSADAPLIVKGGSGAAAGYQLVYEAATKSLRFTISDGTTSASHSAVKDLVSDGLWHHLVAVRDGATLRLYADRVELGVGSPVGGVGSIDTAAALELGRLGGSYAQCLLQDVALYDAPLTPTQVRAHHDEALAVAA